MSIDEALIYCASPTLAGLKMGSLICFPHNNSLQSYEELINSYNQKFNKKGLHFRILYRCPQRTLLYVYRPAMVEAYVRKQNISFFLQTYGYECENTLTDMLNHLSNRIATGGCFPHESGIFLGYPLEDVCGFITNKGNHAKLCGEWKVYGDALKASELFRKFSCCRKAYINRFVVGSSIDSLIVA